MILLIVVLFMSIEEINAPNNKNLTGSDLAKALRCMTQEQKACVTKEQIQGMTGNDVARCLSDMTQEQKGWLTKEQLDKQ